VRLLDAVRWALRAKQSSELRTREESSKAKDNISKQFKGFPLQKQLKEIPRATISDHNDQKWEMRQQKKQQLVPISQKPAHS